MTNQKPVKLELCLIASHENREVVEQLCMSMNVKPQWLKVKGQGKLHVARIWFKRRLPADFIGGQAAAAGANPSSKPAKLGPIGEAMTKAKGEPSHG